MPSTLEARWRDLDAQIRTWWDGDLHRATEAEIAADPKGTLLYLPHPYSSAAGAEAAFPEMYGWDTFFINCGLLAHGRTGIVRGHILNQLHLIERYGFVPNGNRTFYLTRSQPPLLGESIRRYLAATDDGEILAPAHAALKREYEGFWNAPPRRTSCGLATCHDSGDPARRPELAAEAESGRDFTAIYGGDIRRCVPLHVNAALVQTTRCLTELAERLDRPADARHWSEQTEARAEAMRRWCWCDDEQTFLQWDRVAQTHLPHRSLDALWVVWAGVATEAQAAAVVADLPRFLNPYGLSFTEASHPSPHPEYDWVQWGHPSGWPGEQIIAVEALDRAGRPEQATEVARRYLTAQLNGFEATGQLWEKLNTVTGDTALPTERYPVPPFHGWSSASAVLLGQRLFMESP